MVHGRSSTPPWYYGVWRKVNTETQGGRARPGSTDCLCENLRTGFTTSPRAARGGKGALLMKNNVGCLLTRRALLNPKLEALVDLHSGRRFDFAELNRRSNRTANALRGLGVRPGDRVALLLLNGVEFVESFFALAKLGAVVVPVNWRLVPDELAFILKDAGARTLLYSAEFTSNVADLQARGERGHGAARVGPRGPGRGTRRLRTRLRRPAHTGLRRRARAGRRRRRPALHHVHVRHDRAAQGSGPCIRTGRPMLWAFAHDRLVDRRHPVGRPLPDRATDSSMWAH